MASAEGAAMHLVAVIFEKTRYHYLLGQLPVNNYKLVPASTDNSINMMSLAYV